MEYIRQTYSKTVLLSFPFSQEALLLLSPPPIPLIQSWKKQKQEIDMNSFASPLIECKFAFQNAELDVLWIEEIKTALPFTEIGLQDSQTELIQDFKNFTTINSNFVSNPNQSFPPLPTSRARNPRIVTSILTHLLGLPLKVHGSVKSWDKREIGELKHSSDRNVRTWTSNEKLLLSCEIKTRWIKQWSVLSLLYQLLLLKNISLHHSIKWTKLLTSLCHIAFKWD